MASGLLSSWSRATSAFPVLSERPPLSFAITGSGFPLSRPLAPRASVDW
ncbi:hypothetical protein PI125_g23019 [Phytophthora idaei]|nr:hypothetical protein PI125_g23019 [Phytophthora idaei]